ncbi:MAG: hypothetical protein LUH05_07855 [Candidatus Gastranaerophilales bacterium]|nr:hypothetical protein [Candidatus Gastranaerophilales bacterium]
MADEIEVNGQKYEIVDTVEKMTVPDCFVVSSNKIGTAHGEAKFYVGNENEQVRDFFGTKGFNITCFV